MSPNSRALSRDAHNREGKPRKPRLKAAGSAVIEGTGLPCLLTSDRFMTLLAFYSLHKRPPNDAEAKELLHRVQVDLMGHHIVIHS
jgi:hypothetical protein